MWWCFSCGHICLPLTLYLLQNRTYSSTITSSHESVCPALDSNTHGRRARRRRGVTGLRDPRDPGAFQPRPGRRRNDAAAAAAGHAMDEICILICSAGDPGAGSASHFSPTTFLANEFDHIVPPLYPYMRATLHSMCGLSSLLSQIFFSFENHSDKNSNARIV